MWHNKAIPYGKVTLYTNPSTTLYFKDMSKDTYNTLKQAQEDLKYLNRWTYDDFKECLFSTSIDSYVKPKWQLFIRDRLVFIWGCSYNKLELMAKAIDEMKGGE